MKNNHGGARKGSGRKPKPKLKWPEGTWMFVRIPKTLKDKFYEWLTLQTEK